MHTPFFFSKPLNRIVFIMTILVVFSNLMFAQILTGVEPDEGMQGETLDLVISGQNTHFLQATSISVNLQQGTATIIMPQQVVVETNNTLDATFMFSWQNQPGVYDLRVSNEIDGTMYLFDAFEIVENPVQPELVNIEPDNAIQGEELDVIISGQHTHFQASTTTVTLKQGTLTILPQYKQVLSDTEISAHFAFGFYHPPGLYTLNTNNSIDGSLYLYNAFTLNPGQEPEITAIEPGEATIGEIYGFDIYGDNTHFLDAEYMVAILNNDGESVIELDFNVWTNEHIEGAIVIPYGVDAGYYNLTVMNEIDGTMNLTDAVYMNETTNQPQIINISPDSAYMGDWIEVAVGAENTWFTWASDMYVWLKKSGSYQVIQSQSVELIDNESLAASFYLPPSGIPGHYDFYIMDDIDGEMVSPESFFLIDTLVGIPDRNNTNGLTVYPNPATNYFYIQSSLHETESRLAIYNFAGKRLEIPEIQLHPDKPFRIDVSGLPKGFYFIEIITNENIVIEKLIKQ